MELRQLRYFVTVAEELHFGRAAERLMIVQSAVSQQVRRLERELGADLLDRSPRHVRLTEAGRHFLPAARAVLEAEQRALAAVADYAGERSEVLRIGTSTGMGEHLERFLEAVEDSLPGVRVELSTAPTRVRLEQVAHGMLDACFARGVEQGPEGVRLVPVWREPLVAAISARHPLAGRERIDIAELAALPLRLVPRNVHPPLVDLVTGACRDAGFEPVPGPSGGSLQDVLASFAAGPAGWTVLYAAHAEQLATARVRFLPLHEPGPDGAQLALPTVLAVRASMPRARLAALLAACRRDAGAARPTRSLTPPEAAPSQAP
jgi:DNA-binding transcriptional LysR family regulator